MEAKTKKPKQDALIAALSGIVTNAKKHITEVAGARESRVALANTAFRAQHPLVVVRDAGKVAWYGYLQLNPTGYTKIDFRHGDDLTSVYARHDYADAVLELAPKGYVRG